MKNGLKLLRASTEAPSVQSQECRREPQPSIPGSDATSALCVVGKYPLLPMLTTFRRVLVRTSSHVPSTVVPPQTLYLLRKVVFQFLSALESTTAGQVQLLSRHKSPTNTTGGYLTPSSTLDHAPKTLVLAQVGDTQLGISSSITMLCNQAESAGCRRLASTAMSLMPKYTPRMYCVRRSLCFWFSILFVSNFDSSVWIMCCW